jgi:LacI family transcriptional regulator
MSVSGLHGSRDVGDLSIVVDNDFQPYPAAVEARSRVTIREVAARAGVSVATVSKVINSRYGVAASTSARVRGVIEELGYSASLTAQSLRNSRTNVIGVLIGDIEPYNIQLLRGVAEGVRGTGFELVVYSACRGTPEEQAGWERHALARLSGTLVDGALIVTPTIVDLRYGAPIVAVDPHTGPETLPTVDADNLRGGALATEHLLSLGHRRVGMLTGRSDLLSAQLREQGYRSAMAAAGVPVDEDLVQTGGFVAKTAAAAARRLLESAERPTAIFAANDVSAIATVETARQLGLRVPDDLSVVGFDNVPESALCTPPLTTVEQPIPTMGRRAVELLLQLIRDEVPESTHIRLETTLVVRQSTGPPTT